MLWFWRFLTSRNTGIVLLIVVSLILLIGASLPNPSIMSPTDASQLKLQSPLLYWFGENFNSMKIGRSPVFGIVGIVLIISTFFCSIDRLIKRSRAQKSLSPELPPDEKGIKITTGVDQALIVERLSMLFRKDRWKIKVFDAQGRKVVSASKGDTGFWGSLFFHAILVTLLVGLLVYYFSAFYATIKITEGQSIRLTRENLNAITQMPIFGRPLPDLVFKFNQFSAQYYNEFNPTDFSADLDITDMKTGRTWKQILKINDPLHYRGIDFLMVVQGYSPNFILYRNQEPVFDSYIALDFDQEYKDSFDIQEERLHVIAQFFPDMARSDDGGIYTKSLMPKNPYFGLEMFQGGRRVFRKLLGRGESGTFGSYRMVFNDLRHWITIDLVRETGIGFFFICSMIGLAGILVRIMDPEKKILAIIQKGDRENTIIFSSSAKHFEGILKERLNVIIQKFKEKE
jgi:hypothetical protein